MLKQIAQTMLLKHKKYLHTGALGLVRVDGETGLTCRAHGRAIRGAGGTGFGRTVRATAFVG